MGDSTSGFETDENEDCDDEFCEDKTTVTEVVSEPSTIDETTKSDKDEDVKGTTAEFVTDFDDENEDDVDGDETTDVTELDKTSQQKSTSTSIIETKVHTSKSENGTTVMKFTTTIKTVEKTSEIGLVCNGEKCPEQKSTTTVSSKSVEGTTSGGEKETTGYEEKNTSEVSK